MEYKKNKIEIVYSAKDYLLNSFSISQDCNHVYVPSRLSGLSILDLKNLINKGKDQQNSAYEVEINDDNLGGFVKIYDSDEVKNIIKKNEQAGNFFSSFLYLDDY